MATTSNIKDDPRTFLASPSPDHSSIQALSPPSQTANLISSLQTKGYCIIPSFLSADTLHRLRAAAAPATNLARTNQWPHLRTLPKQFPPFGSDAKDGIWGVQHLLHPSMPGRAEFARAYFDPELLALCESLMRDGAGVESGRWSGQVEEGEPLVMELFNLLVRPDRDFELRWHRDSVPFDGISTEEEAKRLGLHDASKRTAHHVQYNMPLYHDTSLVLVPGSHLRPRSIEEQELLAGDPYVRELPNMLIVDLKPGDVVFYDNNVIHRGVYKADAERLTLHGSVGDVRGGTARAQLVLQHDVGEWIGRCTFEELGSEHDATRKRAEAMKQRLVELGRAAGDEGTKAIHAE